MTLSPTLSPRYCGPVHESQTLPFGGKPLGTWATAQRLPSKFCQPLHQGFPGFVLGEVLWGK